jgi:predicted PurR-regulated permease PerM
MLESAAPGAQAMLGWLQAATTGLGGAMANLFLVVVGGLYIATNPRLYRTGLLKLVPAERRELTGTALRDTGRSLRLWLVGQLVSMVLVGTLTGVGLWLIGVPSALVLGLLAGLLEFVPLVGPIVAAIPGLLIAATQGTETLLWALALYFVLQQLEGNIIQPLVQQRAVSLPPALLLFALVAFGTLFGIAGLLLAAPLTVVLFVAVKRLYVREALGTPTPIPGEEK